jgi:hypothetical protein
MRTKLNLLQAGIFLTGNLAWYGGGALDSTADNCTLAGNSAGGWWGEGGGAYYSALNNCTLTGNSARHSGGGRAGAP